MQNNLFNLNNVSKTFKDGTIALNNINLKINKGVTTLIGPSGSGKSTLLRMLNLLEKPTNGNIYYKNEDMTSKGYNLTNHRKKVGMVFQNFHLFPHLSILENLNIAQQLVLNKSKAEASQKSLFYLEKVGLLDKINNFPNQLSGGEKQRIAIARTLCMDVETILFDEPTSALDPEMVKEVLMVMKDLVKESISLIIVTHEMEFAKTFSDTIIVLDKGEIVEMGSPKAIFNNPKTIRTKMFIDSISLNFD